MFGFKMVVNILNIDVVINIGINGVKYLVNLFRIIFFVDLNVNFFLGWLFKFLLIGVFLVKFFIVSNVL